MHREAGFLPLSLLSRFEHGKLAKMEKKFLNFLKNSRKNRRLPTRSKGFEANRKAIPCSRQSEYKCTRKKSHLRTESHSVPQIVRQLSPNFYSTRPYLTLMRSSFSSMGSAANQRNSQVAAAWMQSMGKPEI